MADVLKMHGVWVVLTLTEGEAEDLGNVLEAVVRRMSIKDYTRKHLLAKSVRGDSDRVKNEADRVASQVAPIFHKLRAAGVL